MNWTKTISWITGALVFSLSIASFILSYTALKGVAMSAISADWVWLWPLVIDGAIIVFALVVVYFGLIKHSNIVPIVLVFFFTGVTILFNAIHAGNNGLSVAVGIMPPIALVLSFEVFMWMVKSGIQRTETSQSLDRLVATREKIKTEIDKLAAKRDTQLDKIKELEDDIKAKQVELKAQPEQMIVILGVEPDSLRHAPDKRQPIVRQMLDNQIPAGQIVDILGISAKTLTRDIKALDNGSKARR